MREIFIGRIDLTLPIQNGNNTFICMHRTEWNSFGEQVKVALKDYPVYLEDSDRGIINLGAEMMGLFSFQDLDQKEFNFAIKMLRQYFAALKVEGPDDWRRYGLDGWRYDIEPALMKDQRYIEEDATP